jgi:hypothetical protein
MAERITQEQRMLEVIKTKELEFKYADTLEDCLLALSELENINSIAIDIETYVLNEHKSYGSALDPHVSGISLIALKGEERIYILDILKAGAGIYKFLGKFLESRETLLAFNAVFECKFLYKWSGCLLRNFYDIQVAARLIANATSARYHSSATSASLKNVIRDYLSVILPKEYGAQDWSIRPNKDNKIEWERWVLRLEYCANDVNYLQTLREIMNEVIISPTPKNSKEWEDMFKSGVKWGLGMKDILELEMQFITVAAELEFNGLPVSVPFLEAFQSQLQSEIDRITLEICKMLNMPTEMTVFGKEIAPQEFHSILRSPQKLKKNVLDKLLGEGLIEDTLMTLLDQQVKHLESGDIEVEFADEYEKEKLQDITLLELEQAVQGVKILELLYTLKKYQKQLSMDLLKYVNRVTTRMHPHYKTIGAATGRTSSQNPNGQNISSRTVVELDIDSLFPFERSSKSASELLCLPQ